MKNSSLIRVRVYTFICFVHDSLFSCQRAQDEKNKNNNCTDEFISSSSSGQCLSLSVSDSRTGEDDRVSGKRQAECVFFIR